MSILITEAFSQSAESFLKSNINEIVDRGSTPEQLARAKVLITRSKTLVNAELLNKCPHLQFVVTATSGFDHIDFEACESAQVKLAYAPEANVQSVTELTFALMLALERRLVPAHQAIKSGLWRDSITRGFELSGKTLGIFGLGRVGSRVAQLAKAFGMAVVAFDPYVEESKFQRLEVERIGKIELLRLSDIVSLHLPLTKETRHLINRSTLENMGSEALLINTSRGAIVKEADLHEALINSHLRGAALDVFEKEPLPQKSALKKLPNLIMTPHLGGYSQEAFEKASQLAAEAVIAFLKGSSPPSPLPPNEPWFTHPQFSGQA